MHFHLITPVRGAVIQCVIRSQLFAYWFIDIRFHRSVYKSKVYWPYLPTAAMLQATEQIRLQMQNSEVY